MSSTADARLARFAAADHGLVRLADARRVGLSDRQVQYRVRTGRWDRIGAGVYRVAGVPPTRHQAVLAAVWRSSGVASHRSAAELHGLWSPGRERPEVTVHTSAMHHVDGANRAPELGPRTATVVRRSGIPCTDVPRTLVDVGAVVDARRVEAMVHAARHRRLTDLDAVTSEYLSVSRRGRHGAGPIGEVLRALDPLVAAAESELEVVLVRILREHGLPTPTLQFEVRLRGRLVRLDVCYPEHRLFIEGDGFGVHGTRTAFEDDRWRQNLLVADGWRPLRFTWRQLLQRPGEVAAQVRRALDLPR